MRFYKKAVLLLTVTVVLFGIVFYFYNKKSEDVEVQTETKSFKFLEINSNDIVGIEMKNKGGQFDFKKDEGQWKAVNPENLKFDISRINGILYAASNLEAEETIESKPNDIKQYGLDKPSTITFKMNNGSSYTLEIGNLTPFKDGYYIKKKGEDSVYKANNGLVKELLREKLDFRDKRLFDMVIEEYTALNMKKDDKAILNIEKNDILWKITEPVQGRADLNGVEPVLTMFSYLCINDYVEDNAKELGKYGLDKPTYSFSIKSSKINKTLALGKTLKDGESIYAKFIDSNDIFELNLKDLYLMDNPTKELRIFPYIELLENVEGININVDSNKFDVKIDANKNNMSLNKYYINGKKVEAADSNTNPLFLKFYQSIVGIPMAEIDTNYKPAGNAEITFSYTLKIEPKAVKIDFVPKDDLYYYVLKDGKHTGMLALKSSFNEPDGLKGTYKSLMNELNKGK